MAYSVKEIFYSLQGEGLRTGDPAVFLRFAGCNLWSGREEDRSGADCDFCDTDFVGTDGENGGRFETADDLAEAVADHWPDGARRRPFVVVTGGEPGLQLDAALLDALHRRSCEVAVETNGTVALPEGVDWITVSPKAGTDLLVRTGDELKLVYPQDGIDPVDYLRFHFLNYLLQPLDGEGRKANTKACLDYCLAHPRWRLSLQTHKLLGIK